MLRHLGKRPLAKKIDELFATLDVNKDGSIDFDEFCRYFNHEHFVDEVKTKPKEAKVASPKKTRGRKKKVAAKPKKGKGKKGAKPTEDEPEDTPAGKKQKTEEGTAVVVPQPVTVTPKEEIDAWFITHPHESIRALAIEVAMMSLEAVLSVSKIEWTAVASNILVANAIVAFLNQFLT